ncbi:hypothetical protein [Desertivirga xinjiangensis]|uniref:hypothetical protein n=1 Tax=Desertivirga xinjiangensis TaxID=539206 RepID=UPI00210C530D|nr:hypothetical protein [Pedobacter xinjiangensis]
MQIDSEVIDEETRSISMSNVVRQIDAFSRELAIGKFVIATQGIKALKKMDIECYDLSELLSV